MFKQCVYLFLGGFGISLSLSIPVSAQTASEFATEGAPDSVHSVTQAIDSSSTERSTSVTEALNSATDDASIEVLQVESSSETSLEPPTQATQRIPISSRIFPASSMQQ